MKLEIVEKEGYFYAVGQLRLVPFLLDWPITSKVGPQERQNLKGMLVWSPSFREFSLCPHLGMSSERCGREYAVFTKGLSDNSAFTHAFSCEICQTRVQMSTTDSILAEGGPEVVICVTKKLGTACEIRGWIDEKSPFQPALAPHFSRTIDNQVSQLLMRRLPKEHPRRGQRCSERPSRQPLRRSNRIKSQRPGPCPQENGR